MTTSLLSLLMMGNSGPADSTRRMDGLHSPPDVPSLATNNECYYSRYCPPTTITSGQTIRNTQQELPLYSYSPDAYDCSSGTTRILEEPPLDATSNDASRVVTPTVRNTTCQRPLPVVARMTMTSSSRHCPTISPPSNSRIADLERAYDRDTWRLFHRIQRARSLQQRHNNNNNNSQSNSQDELPNNQHLICADDLSDEEGEDDDRMPTEPEEDEQFLFDMD